MSAEEVAKAFTTHFYTTLDSTPANLASLYQPQSTLTFEGQAFVGSENIVAKYQVSNKEPSGARHAECCISIRYPC